MMIRLTIAAISAALVLATGAARADGDAKRGEKLFEECHACHSTEAGSQGVGPSLRGVFGRKAGEQSDFRYSPAIKRSGITWTPQTLDGFIAGPEDDVEQLFKWIFGGDTEIPVQGGRMTLKMSQESARLLQDAIETTGALVSGRRTFDPSSGSGRRGLADTRGWHDRAPGSPRG